jgi:hypothetical protein
MIRDASFSEAVDVAQSEFEEALPHLHADIPGYGWTIIWDARENGRMPLHLFSV